MQNQPGDETASLIYALRFVQTARNAQERAFLFMELVAGIDTAFLWQDAYYEAVATLGTLPTRKPAAPEATFFALPVVRVLLFRASPGGAQWRVLFRVIEADTDEGPRVQILTIRHGAAQPLTPQEGRDIDAANG